MTDNFDQLYKYMKNLGIEENSDKSMNSDLFFDIQLIRRGKDHPNMPAANYTFKTYYIDNLNSFKKQYEEIKKYCDMFGLRAYISVNAKSKRTASLKTLERYAHDIAVEEFKKPWKIFSSICGGLNGKEKRWIIDCDNTEVNSNYINDVCKIIRYCNSSYNDPIIDILNTKSGIHIITHPFNLKQLDIFCKEYNIEKPDVKKNHITLLYENI